MPDGSLLAASARVDAKAGQAAPGQEIGQRRHEDEAGHMREPRMALAAQPRIAGCEVRERRPRLDQVTPAAVELPPAIGAPQVARSASARPRRR